MNRFPVNLLKPYDQSPERVNVVVETPKGSRVKYYYDEDRGMYLITKILPQGMVFPFNFGLIPGTLAADGDPLDMLILNDEPMVSNTLARVMPIAVIIATQTE